MSFVNLIKITTMKGILLSCICCSYFLFAQIPANYYDGVAGLSGYSLKSKLHKIISTKTIAWNYGDLPAFYEQTDIDHHYDFDETNSTYLLDLYSNNPLGTTAYHYTSSQLIGSTTGEGDGYNREHMMPQSSFNSNYPMYSDLFFVIPTDAKINQLRSNFPYAMAGSPIKNTFTNGSKIGKNATLGATYTGNVYEPIDEFKGDVARSLLYFVVRYEGKLNTFNFFNGANSSKDTSPLDGTEEKSFEDWYLRMLLEWHSNDPVSAREIERNNKVFSIQHNRNPFIDHPEFVNLIWNQTMSNDLVQAPGNLAAQKVSAYFVNLSWTPSPSANLLGYKIYKDGIYIGYSKNTSFTADHLLQSTSYQFTVKAYGDNYSESADTNVLHVSTLNTDVYAKDLMITKYFEGTDNNKALEITNKTGHAIDLNHYRISAQFYNSVNDNYYFPAPYELEGVIENNQTFVILNPNANFSCITNEDAKFLSASPHLNFNGSNYVELRYKSTRVDALGSPYINNSATLENVSLYRKPNVHQPNGLFDSSEWNTYGVDYCKNLGVLNVYNSSILKKDSLSIYPNPVINGKLFFNFKNLNLMTTVQIFDSSGKLALQINNPFKYDHSVDVSKLLPGMYLIQIGDETLKFIKK